MSSIPSPEERISMAGLGYGRRNDIASRAGLVLQMLGAAALAVLYPLVNPFYTVGIMLFDLGVLLSATSLLGRLSWVKKLIVGVVVFGLVLQAEGCFFAPEQYAGSVVIAGIVLVSMGAAGMAGKEAYYFGYREGWLLMILGFPVLALENLLGKENRIVNSFGFSIVFLLLLSLCGKKLRQQLQPLRAANTCEPPSKHEH